MSKKEKISHEEYFNIRYKYQIECFFDLGFKSNVEKFKIKDEYNRISKLYKKQHRFNIFKFLYIRYKKYIKYGKSCIFFYKSLILTAFFYFLLIICAMINKFWDIGTLFSTIIMILYDPSKKTQKSSASVMNLTSNQMEKSHYFLIIYSLR